MFDPKKLLDDLMGTQVPGTGGTVREGAGKVTQMAKDNPLAAGAIAAVLLGTGAGRQVTGTALRLGGMAAVAGLAYKAYQNYRSGGEPGAAPADAAREPVLLPSPADTPFDPHSAPQGEAEFALTLVRAMVAAAKADGHIDDAEKSRIADKLRTSGLEADAGAFLLAELDKPLDLDTLVAGAHTEAQRAELYTAARLAIDPNTRAERGFLDLLAGRLKLPDALVDHIEATVAEVKVPV